jgi:hypothetical protein
MNTKIDLLSPKHSVSLAEFILAADIVIVIIYTAEFEVIHSLKFHVITAFS